MLFVSKGNQLKKYIKVHNINVRYTQNFMLIDSEKITYNEKIELINRFNFTNNNGLLMITLLN